MSDDLILAALDDLGRDFRGLRNTVVNSGVAHANRLDELAAEVNLFRRDLTARIDRLQDRLDAKTIVGFGDADSAEETAPDALRESLPLAEQAKSLFNLYIELEARVIALEKAKRK